MKLFTALKLPTRLTQQIIDVQRGVSGARWSEPEKLHITTAFYGEVDDDHAEALDFELARHPLPSLELQLEGVGHFGNFEPHAIWLGVKENPALLRLHEHCKTAARRAGVRLEKRKYLPHVTLAYLRPTTPLERVIAFEKRLSRFNCAPFIVDEMHLFSSLNKNKATNLYRIEASYPMILS
ncbi:MAG: RNA 2',3'-cyclic phosphodiesterase [Hellea sp.]